MSLDHYGAAVEAGSPTVDEAVRSALGSVRAEGLEPDAAGMALFDAVRSGEMSIDDAIEQALAQHGA